MSPCQIRIKVQSDNADPLKQAYQTRRNQPRDTNKIKEAAHQLANIANDDNPPPTKRTIIMIAKFKSSNLLVETNTVETADWFKHDPLRPPTTNPRTTTERSYPVIMPLVPMLFQSNDEGIHKLEQIANINELAANDA